MGRNICGDADDLLLVELRGKIVDRLHHPGGVAGDHERVGIDDRLDRVLDRAELRPSLRRAGCEDLVHTVADGIKLRGIGIGDLDYPGSPVAERVAISQRELGELTPVSEVGTLGSGLFGSGRYVVLNAGHSVLKSLLEGGKAALEPELSAYLTVKLLYLRDELSPERDGRLAARALEGRCRR